MGVKELRTKEEAMEVFMTLCLAGVMIAGVVEITPDVLCAIHRASVRRTTRRIVARKRRQGVIAL